MFRETLEKAEAGDNCGALIKNVKRHEIRRGQVLCKPGSCKLHNHVEAQVSSSYVTLWVDGYRFGVVLFSDYHIVQVYMLSTEEGGRAKPITNNFQPQIFCQTWDFPGYIRLKDRDMIMPGEDATVNIAIKTKMVNC